MQSPLAPPHGWLFGVGALLFGVLAPWLLLEPTGLLGTALVGLAEEQAQLLVLTASAVLLAAAPLRGNQPGLAAVAAGAHVLAALLALALACASTLAGAALGLWWLIPVPWLTAAVFTIRARRLWQDGGGARRGVLLALLSLVLYLPAIGAGHWMSTEWRRVVPLLASTDGATRDAALNRGWWLTRLDASQDLDLWTAYCESSGEGQSRLAEAGKRLFEEDYAAGDCWGSDE